MIHDAIVEVTCDGMGCNASEYVTLRYVYGSTMHASGRYDDDEKRIEEDLTKDHEWIIRDGKHYCCESCADDKEGLGD
jgi:hypothetical protein